MLGAEAIGELLPPRRTAARLSSCPDGQSTLVATVGAIVALSVYVLLALLAGRIAQGKGRPFALYFIVGLLLGPISLIAAAVLPRHRRLV
jgi:hypothetical protein